MPDTFPNRTDKHGVPGLVRRLVSHHIGRDSNSKEVDALHAYALRVIGSRMTSSVVSDEYAVAEQLKRKLVRSGHTSDALAFAELTQRLSVKAEGMITQRWALLHLLSSLSNIDKAGSKPAGAKHASSSSTFESSLVFTGVTAGVPTQSRKPTSSDADPAQQARKTAPTVDSNTAVWYREYNAKYRIGGPGLNTTNQVPEDDLLRDMLFVFQGIDGKYIRYDRTVDGYVVDPTVGVSRANRDLIRELSELGWLFRRLNQNLELFSAEGGGRIRQSLTGAVRTELAGYYKLLAVLEAKVRIPVPSTKGSAGTAVSGDTGAHLTLRRLLVWVQDVLPHLKLLAIVVDSAADKRGGELVSAIYAHLQHGDPAVPQLVHRVLTRACEPIFDMIRSWVLEGILHDPFQEFFVSSNPETKLENFWNEKYALRSEMIPSFISQELAGKIFRIGKSLNFLRECCHEADRDISYTDNRFVGFVYSATGTSTLEVEIDEIAESTNKALLRVMFETMQLRDHFLALKRYLLLGAGDFVQALIGILGPDLSQPAARTFRHNLTGLLEQATRQSNAQHDPPGVLGRLDVRLLEPSDGDKGWDIFSLDYRVDVPLNTIFHPAAMNVYLRLFNLLWRLKRVETSLGAVWRRQNFQTHLAVKHRGFLTKFSSSYLLRSKMTHFINNFSHFVMFEVVEVAWAQFMSAVDSAKDLDDIIAAQNNYLAALEQGLLLIPKPATARMLVNLNKIFDLVLRFAHVQETLHASADEELAQLQQTERDITNRQAGGSWGTRSAEEGGGDSELAKSIQVQVLAMGDEFEELVQSFLDQLVDPANGDHEELRFLSFRLDFNEYFARQSESVQA